MQKFSSKGNSTIIGNKRILAFPQAIKATTGSYDAFKTDKKGELSITEYGRIHASEHPSKPTYAFFARNGEKKIRAYVLDNTKNNGTQLFLMKTIEIDYHECHTEKPNGAKERHSPLGYIHFSGNDYFVLFSTGKEDSSGKCTGKFGKYWIFKDDYSGSSDWNVKKHLSTNQGATAFYNPSNTINGENLGLPTFSGYSKCVDILVTNYLGSPNVVSLVFYEDT